MIFRIFFVFLFSFVFILPSKGFAQGHGMYCEQADSTAATQQCLKKHLDTAQNRLNRIYKLLDDALEGERKEELAALQKTWLEYRDAECMWEAENSENSSLKRINELSCMARVTDDRADILTVVHEDKIQLDTVREYGSFPRWMNVVAKENPRVYWDYGSRKGFDLDCDGEDEYLMSGITTQPAPFDKNEEAEEEVSDVKNFNNVLNISITQNPAVGKPTTKIFKFPIQQEDSAETICSQYFEQKFNEGDVLSEEITECQASLEIQSEKCMPKIIQWDGKDFALVEMSAEDTEEGKE